MAFVNLSVKSGYSFFNSALKINDIVSLAKKFKMNSVALTDKNSLFGAMEFYHCCLKNDIKPIIGIEIDCHIENDISEPFPLIFLAKNLVDYKNLIKIAALVGYDGFKSIDIKDLDIIKDLITILPSSRANFKKYLNNNSYFQITDLLSNRFSDFYIGLEFYCDEDFQLIDSLRYYNKKIKMVALNHTCYEAEDSYVILETLQAIENHYERIQLKNHQEYFKNQIIMEKYFSIDEINQSQSIADRCNLDLLECKSSLLEYPLEDIDDKNQYLRALVLRGIKKRLNNKVTNEYYERINYELKVINDMGYIDYFLIVLDYVRFAKKNNIIVGPGRGSAPGALVSYSLGITDVDPIKYHLSFERFLNPSRQSMPDIDLDFADNNRMKIIDYLKEKYQDKFANIITYQTFASKAALRDVGKVLKIDINIIDKISKLISSHHNIDFIYENSKAFKQYMDKYPKLFRLSKSIIGLPRQISIHAAGIVLSNIPLNEVIPTYLSQSGLLTQFDMKYLEELGLLKMDILGLTNLTVIDLCLKYIDKYYKISVDLKQINLDDKNLLKMISDLETSGIFQLESEGMKRTIKNVNPDSFIEISNIIALFRPGPMDSISQYVFNKKNPHLIKYLHPSLKQILNDTRGIIIYQEQINQIAISFAGMSPSDADLLRRAISKKDTSQLNRLKQSFFDAARSKKIDEKTIVEVFDLIVKFVNYGFNKAHSVSYAVIAMEMAYLKFYYRAAFICALLSTFAIASTSKFTLYLRESKKHGIEFIFPDINIAQRHYFPLDNKHIVFSFTTIKGLNNKTIDNIIEERNNGKFTDFSDFLIRMMKYKINLNQVELLIYSGAFDSFEKRLILLGSLESFYKYAEIAQTTSEIGLNLIPKPISVSLEGVDLLDLLLKEKEILGAFISALPLDRQKYNNLNYPTINQLDKLLNKEVVIIVIVLKYRIIKDKNGKYMALITGYDETGEVNLTLFSNEFQENQKIFTENKFLKVIGRVNNHNGQLNIVVNRLNGEDILDGKNVIN